jgi:SAM-dependent methyltransferase
VAIGRARNPQWHRGAVGGMWDTMGRAQFEYLVAEGLQPAHRLLDIGCGSLRAGLHFIEYLDPGNYSGIDTNGALIRGGLGELKKAGLEERRPHLVVNGNFEFSGVTEVDFALAHSVFTHLPLNRVMRCVARTSEVLRPGGRFYATFFANRGPRLRYQPLHVWGAANRDRLDAFCDADPYYYDPDVFRWMCEGSELRVEYRGEWGPRGQHMLVFTRG